MVETTPFQEQPLFVVADNKGREELMTMQQLRVGVVEGRLAIGNVADVIPVEGTARRLSSEERDLISSSSADQPAMIH